MKDKYIKALESIGNPTINTKNDLEIWKVKAINIVGRIYGDDSKEVKQIEQIEFINYLSTPIISSNNYHPPHRKSDNNAKHCEKKAQEIINSYIFDLKNFGIPKPKIIGNNKEINISVNQNQNLNQSINVSLIKEIIQDELKGSQLKEIEKVLKSNEQPETKRKKIIDKLKSFGSDVSANIIANLLTNLAIFNGHI